MNKFKKCIHVAFIFICFFSIYLKFDERVYAISQDRYLEKEINSSINGGIYKGGAKEQLNNLIEKAQGLNLIDKTKKSIIELNLAIESSINTLNNDNSSEKHYNEAIMNLSYKMGELRNKDELVNKSDLEIIDTKIQKIKLSKAYKVSRENEIKDLNEAINDLIKVSRIDNITIGELETKEIIVDEKLLKLEYINIVDKSKLNGSLKAANSFDYSQKSKFDIKEIEEVINQAIVITNDILSTQEEVDEIKNKLDEILSKSKSRDEVANEKYKNILIEKIKKAKEIDKKKYSKASIINLLSQTEIGQKYAVNENITVGKVEEAVINIDKAMEGLRLKSDLATTGDIALLQEIIKKSNIIIQQAEDEALKEKIKDGINNANLVISDRNATVDDIEKAYINLDNILNKVNNNKLSKNTSKGSNTGNKSNSSAPSHVHNTSNTSQGVEASSNTHHIIDTTDISQLQELTIEAEKLDVSKMSEESVKVFNEALKEADILLKSENIKKENINTAYKRLSESIKNLKHKEINKSKELPDLSSEFNPLFLILGLLILAISKRIILGGNEKYNCKNN